MQKSLYIFILVSIFLSCTLNEPTKLDVLKEKDVNQKVRKQENNPANKVILEKIFKHEFSTIGKLDEFKISLTGKSIIEGRILFTIKNNEGIIIYKEQFESTDLLSEFLDESSSKVKEKEIKRRLYNFFDQVNFKCPAIKKDEQFSDEFTNKPIFIEIKSDPSAIGFRIITGSENGTSIVYSKILKKVVAYYNCC